MLGHDGLELGPAVLEGVEVDAHDAEPAIAVRLVDLIEPGDLGGIGQAPARPEDHEDDIALERGQVERLAVDVHALDGRGGLADQVELTEPVGAVFLDIGVGGSPGRAVGRPCGPRRTARPGRAVDSRRRRWSAGRGCRAGPTARRPGRRCARADEPAEVGQRLVVVAPVGRGDDVDRLGQEPDDRRGGVRGLQDAIGGRLGLGEQVVGDGQAEEQSRRSRRPPWAAGWPRAGRADPAAAARSGGAGGCTRR